MIPNVGYGKRQGLFSAVCLAALLGWLSIGSSFGQQPSPPAASAPTGDSAPGNLHRSPVDLLISPDQTWLATANQTSDSVSLVDLQQGRVLAEVRVGRRPEAIALCPDGRRILVSCSYSGELWVLQLAEGGWRPAAVIPVGFHPHGIAVRNDGRTAYVAQAAAAAVAVVDLRLNQVVRQISVGNWPRYLALSGDQSRLAVGVSGERGVAVVDTEGEEAALVQRFMGLNLGQMAVSSDGRQLYFPWIVYRRNPITETNIRQGWVLASRIGRMPFDGAERREAISLDPPGQAVADPHGIGLTPDQSRLVVSASGTHELLVLRAPELPFLDAGGPDHLDPRLRSDPDRFFRVPLGGRPMGLRVGRDNRSVFVANYLNDSVQVVDLVRRELVRTIPLGGPDAPGLARRGEAIFYDGQRSLDQWYSCHSCHYEGGENAVVMDTQNDHSSFTFKTVLPLYGLHETGPWTWHGWQTSLTDAMHASFTSTLLGPEPAEQDIEALLAYFRQLEPPPNPYRTPDGGMSDSAIRGQAVFQRLDCADCHRGPRTTDGQIHEVGTGRADDRLEGYNTPSLTGVYRKVLLLHDGRAASLEELLDSPDHPAQVSDTASLSPRDKQDLIQYLRSL